MPWQTELLLDYSLLMGFLLLMCRTWGILLYYACALLSMLHKAPLILSLIERLPVAVLVKDLANSHWSLEMYFIGM